MRVLQHCLFLLLFVVFNLSKILIEHFQIQSECGDYSPLDYPDYRYVSSGNVQFVPNQSPAFQKEVMEQHKKVIFVNIIFFNFVDLFSLLV